MYVPNVPRLRGTTIHVPRMGRNSTAWANPRWFAMHRQKWGVATYWRDASSKLLYIFDVAMKYQVGGNHERGWKRSPVSQFREAVATLTASASASLQLVASSPHPNSTSPGLHTVRVTVLAVDGDMRINGTAHHKALATQKSLGNSNRRFMYQPFTEASTKTWRVDP